MVQASISSPQRPHRPQPRLPGRDWQCRGCASLPLVAAPRPPWCNPFVTAGPLFRHRGDGEVAWVVHAGRSTAPICCLRFAESLTLHAVRAPMGAVVERDNRIGEAHPRVGAQCLEGCTSSRCQQAVMPPKGGPRSGAESRVRPTQVHRRASPRSVRVAVAEEAAHAPPRRPVRARRPNSSAAASEDLRRGRRLKQALGAPPATPSGRRSTQPFRHCNRVALRPTRGAVHRRAGPLIAPLPLRPPARRIHRRLWGVRFTILTIRRHVNELNRCPKRPHVAITHDTLFATAPGDMVRIPSRRRRGQFRGTASGHRTPWRLDRRAAGRCRPARYAAGHYIPVSERREPRLRARG